MYQPCSWQFFSLICIEMCCQIYACLLICKFYFEKELHKGCWQSIIDSKIYCTFMWLLSRVMREFEKHVLLSSSSSMDC